MLFMLAFISFMFRVRILALLRKNDYLYIVYNSFFYRTWWAFSLRRVVPLKNVFGKRAVTKDIGETFNNTADFIKFVTHEYAILAAMHILDIWCDWHRDENNWRYEGIHQTISKKDSRLDLATMWHNIYYQGRCNKYIWLLHLSAM